jgi:hypothetical protein
MKPGRTLFSRQAHEEAKAAITTTVASSAPAPLDPAKLAELLDRTSEATAMAIMAMIKVAGPATVISNEYVPPTKIVITCHPDVYREITRLFEEARRS